MLSLIHTRAFLGCFVPGIFRVEIAAPEREIAALGRSNFIDGATFVEENAVTVGKVIPCCVRIEPRPHVFRDNRFAGYFFMNGEEIDEFIELVGVEIDDSGFAATALPALLASKRETVFPKGLFFHDENDRSKLKF